MCEVVRNAKVALLAAAALLLSACGGADEPVDGAAAADDQAARAQDDGTQTDASGEGDGAGPAGADDSSAEDDETEASDEDVGGNDGLWYDVVPFDPEAVVNFTEVSYIPTMSDEEVFPLANMLLPEDIPWPATAEFVQASVLTTDEAEPVRRNNGAFQVMDPDADEELVMGFFYDRLPDLGWHLDEERSSDSFLKTIWKTEMPHDDPERYNHVTLDVEFLAPNEDGSRDIGTLRWWLDNSEEFTPFTPED